MVSAKYAATISQSKTEKPIFPGLVSVQPTADLPFRPESRRVDIRRHAPHMVAESLPEKHGVPPHAVRSLRTRSRQLFPRFPGGFHRGRALRRVRWRAL